MSVLRQIQRQYCREWRGLLRTFSQSCISSVLSTSQNFSTSPSSGSFDVAGEEHEIFIIKKLLYMDCLLYSN